MPLLLGCFLYCLFLQEHDSRETHELAWCPSAAFFWCVCVCANHNLFPANRRRLAVKGSWVTGFLGEPTAWFQALSTCSFGSRPKCAKEQLFLFGLKRAQPANQATLLIPHNESRKRLERFSWATLPSALWDRHFSGRVYTFFSPGKKSDIPTNQSSLPLLGKVEGAV